MWELQVTGPMNKILQPRIRLGELKDEKGNIKEGWIVGKTETVFELRYPLDIVVSWQYKNGKEDLEDIGRKNMKGKYNRR